MRKNHEMRKGRPAAGALFFFAALLWGTALTAADQVFCTTFPVYLFTRNIMQGAPRQPELLLPANLGCPHDYAVTPQDLRKVSGGSPLLLVLVQYAGGDGRRRGGRGRSCKGSGVTCGRRKRPSS